MDKKIFYVKNDKNPFKMLLEVNIDGNAFITDLNIENASIRELVVKTVPFEEIKGSLFKEVDVIDYIKGDSNQLKILKDLKEKYPDDIFFKQ